MRSANLCLRLPLPAAISVLVMRLWTPILSPADILTPALICCSGKVLLSLGNNKGASGWLKKHIFGSQNKSRLSSRSLSGIDSDDSIDTRGSPLSMVRAQSSALQICRGTFSDSPVLCLKTLQIHSPDFP